jgi:hypothetical protein
MRAEDDPIIPMLETVLRADGAADRIGEALDRVLQALAASDRTMAWEVLPLGLLGANVPSVICSCWVFGIRAGAETTAERHPNSHQRSLSLRGGGVFEVHDGGSWTPHALVSVAGDVPDRKWVSIPPGTWHRLLVARQPWGMVSFHTVPANELIEEKPVDPFDLAGPTEQQRYAASLRADDAEDG